jgi:hypothetical protein
MSDDVLLRRLAGVRRVGFLGLAKNTGKTTALNFFSRMLHDRGERLGLLTCGRDGETADLLYGNPKPPVTVVPGQLLLTTEIDADRATAGLRQVSDPGFHTALGPLRIFEVEQPGAVVLVGPGTVDELAAASEGLLARCDRILVDGAVNRRAFARPGVVDGVVVCTGAALSGDVDTLVGKTVNAVVPFLFPRYTVVEGVPEFEVFHPFTDKTADTLIQGEFCGLVIVADPSCIFLDPYTLARLEIAGIGIAVRERVPILALCVNPTSPTGKNVDGEALIELLSEALPDTPIIDVMAG